MPIFLWHTLFLIKTVFMNKISIEKVNVKYANENISISDLFIDGYSLQEILKSTFESEFSKGRFKEFFVPVLGLDFSNKLDFDNDSLTNLIPHKNQSVITPIYGCHDDCCLYVFIQVSRKENTIIWDKIGRNSNFIFDKDSKKNEIEWLKLSKEYHFDLENYKTVINKLK
jgi:hypothetical protein